jgi:hypothetical protein
MSLWSYIWPWGKGWRERVKKERQIEERFQKQLQEAEQRQFNLEAAVTTIREDRELRETVSQRPSADPVMQE